MPRHPHPRRRSKPKTPTPQPTTPKLIRRTPTQARGQLRVDEILDATERLTRTTSWEALTTNHIAREARVPIGSLYQFFANKEAIAYALVERYRASLTAAFAQLPTNIETMTPAEVVNLVFDNLLMAVQPHLGLHALLLTAGDDSTLGQIAAPIIEQLRGNIEQVLAVCAPWLSAADRRLHAMVSQLTNRALFAQGVRLLAKGDTDGAQQLFQQARVIQTAYYNHLLQEHEALTNS